MATVTRDVVDRIANEEGKNPESSGEADDQQANCDEVSPFVFDESFDYDNVPLERKF